MADSKEPTKRVRAKRQPPMVRRQDLLAVTISCLARLGPRGTTGREICRQAGVSHGLLRHYFSKPDNLLLETYQELCDHFIARFEQALEADTDPRAALDRFFAVLFSEEWASSDILGAWTAFWSLVRNNEEFAQVSSDYNKRLHALLRAALTRFPQSDLSAPLDDVVPILSALMDGLWLDFCLSPSRLSRERALDLWNLTLGQLVLNPRSA
ncbi:TetR/AcrR family transcriptional regulator [Sphingosinicella terrae]|uniref:TetR/AcrR family transcriptional regulator n=1 Tax=Sphingosinicella terrae TaxID=2172047 RepID=UPI000E0DC6B1|nr:TetR family transcriptional regulator C-terminal domain-containing protein [Sphingosinicella terrae]